MKPALIDSLGRLAVARTPFTCGLDSLQAIEASFGADLLAQDPKSTFDVKELTAFQWPEPAFVTYTKTDILNKNAPVAHIENAMKHLIHLSFLSLALFVSACTSNAQQPVKASTTPARPASM
ncbi:MAG: hypothetical protein IPH05_18525 [Flavobacteriales bacterium]|nr:hypothetical protein [Flavobacteriales bacterium]